MPKDDISHLPPDVQASIKAAREKAKKDQAADSGNPTLPPQARAAMSKARAGMKESMQDAVDRVMAKRAAKQKAETYVVKPGDSLSKIAKELLGDAARWPEIFELNKDQIKDPNLIHVGQELRLP
ncbi:MAG: LysM peptidoglycan-binding domain-containing protein [Anaerolineae bacterium]|nr:LysM peptidoglycan-binding domain-containing protein [Anaerolineae bacterium]